MTCARRQAGAQRPAPSAGSPRRPDPRTGRPRARLSRLLPVLALLLGALSPFAAAPAAAQDVWSATLNPVVDTFSNLGCYSHGTDAENTACSDTDVLDDNDFVRVVGGSNTTYTFVRITDQSNGDLRVHFDGTGVTKTAFSGLSFCVGTDSFAFSSATVTDRTSSDTSQFVWSSANLNWASGTPVSLKIASSCAASATPAAPTFNPADGATTSAAGTNITLTFDEAIKADASATDFTDTTIDTILTLKSGSSSGTDIDFNATINSAKTVVTIRSHPTSDLSLGDVYVAISNGWYDGDGNQGAAANATFTVAASGTLSNDATLSALAATVATSATSGRSTRWTSAPSLRARISTARGFSKRSRM